MKLLLIGGTCLALAGCATSSANITASYSSPWKYDAYSCRQLAMEDDELTTRTASLRGQIDRRATNDKIAVGVALVAFWPAAFLIKGDGEQTAEYARLKGEHEAIGQAASVKGCAAGAPALQPATYAPAPPPESYTAAPPPAPQPYPVAPAPAVYAVAAPRAAPPAPVAYLPPPASLVTAASRPYTETERMRTTQAVIDTYGR